MKHRKCSRECNAYTSVFLKVNWSLVLTLQLLEYCHRGRSVIMSCDAWCVISTSGVKRGVACREPRDGGIHRVYLRATSFMSVCVELSSCMSVRQQRSSPKARTLNFRAWRTVLSTTCVNTWLAPSHPHISPRPCDGLIRDGRLAFAWHRIAAHILPKYILYFPTNSVLVHGISRVVTSKPQRKAAR